MGYIWARNIVHDLGQFLSSLFLIYLIEPALRAEDGDVVVKAGTASAGHFNQLNLIQSKLN